MSDHGYYRHPSIHGDHVVFASEDDLWEVPRDGGFARRLTLSQGSASRPAHSPDGSRVAFSCDDDGATEVHVMPARGGPHQRLTFQGDVAEVIGWRPGNNAVLFSSGAALPFPRLTQAFAVHPDGGHPQPLNLGPVRFVSHHRGLRVVATHQDDISSWKRYRGGLAGRLWIERGDAFAPLIDLPGNLARPLWLNGRVFFVSDHEGHGDLYSCTHLGLDLQRHTHHTFYVRHPRTDGRRIVYHSGADLWCFDPSSNTSAPIPISWTSTRPHRARRFVHASLHLEDAHLHPDGHALVLNVRGQTQLMGLFEGPARAIAPQPDVRQRLASFRLDDDDGVTLVLVSDEGGEEALELHDLTPGRLRRRLDKLDLGRVTALLLNPQRPIAAVCNHRHELLLVDLDAGTATTIDRSPHARIEGLSFSPCGQLLAYDFAPSARTAHLKLLNLDTLVVSPLTRPDFCDTRPSFSPCGRYLYFVSDRDFDPVYDAHTFALGFPEGARLCLLILALDTPSPFTPTPRPLVDDNDDTRPDDNDDNDSPLALLKDRKDRKDHKNPREPGADAPQNDATKIPGKNPKDPKDPKASPPPTLVDLEGIERRVVLFPLPPGQFGRIEGARDRVFFSSYPIRGALDDDEEEEHPSDGELMVFDFDVLEANAVMEDIQGFSVGADGKTLIVRANDRLRLLDHDRDKPPEEEAPGRKSGWVELGRLSIEVQPAHEWRQMLREAWRLMRDQFWREDMSGVDWAAVYARYSPLVDRVGTREELSDLIWELQGELSTSHAYESGGDHRPSPVYPVGHLGATLSWDPTNKGYRIDAMIEGDLWLPNATSPLNAPGLDVQIGDVILSINDRATSRQTPVGALLVDHAGEEVSLLISRPGSPDGPRRVAVHALASEQEARYRQWVEARRERVHAQTKGRVGYVHIPDMAARGFGEFHRAGLTELERDALIVDVRYNEGGHVSPLLLERLARRRLGVDASRWGAPTSYPAEAVAGPLVALANEYAGSDGDVFCHGFKMMKLGVLMGQRTWGGVVGIWPRHPLVDGTTTTQPEFSSWFADVGWGLENRGAEPDIVVDVAPHDDASGLDVQLEAAIQQALQLLAATPPAPMPED